MSLKKHLSNLSAGAKNYFSVSNKYDAAQQSDYVSQTSINTEGANADSHYESDAHLYKMSELGWDLYRNNAVVSPSIDRLVTNILQHGFTVAPNAGSKTKNDLLQKKWAEWTNDRKLCDVQGEFDFNMLSTMALRDSIVAGDCVALPLKTGELQMIEYYRIRTPEMGPGASNKNIIHGVQLDSNRKRTKYYIAKDNIPYNQPLALNDATGYKVYDNNGNRQLFHVFHPGRSTQTRGVSKLVPTMDFCRMYNDIHFARLVQQQAVSAYTFFRKREFGVELPEEDNFYNDQNACTGGWQDMTDVGVGSMYSGIPGEDFSVISSNVPNPTFFDHLQAIERLIGLNLDLPLIVLNMDASETNFSGWRGATEQAKLKFKYFQRWFVNCWYRPIYEFKLRQWTNPASQVYDPVLAKLRSQVGDTKFFSAEWITPGWPYVDPTAELQADIDSLANLVTSPRRIQRRQGRQWNEVIQEIVEDKMVAIELAIKAADKLNNKYFSSEEDKAKHINWFDLVSFPRPAGDNVSDTRDVNDLSKDKEEGPAGLPAPKPAPKSPPKK